VIDRLLRYVGKGQQKLVALHPRRAKESACRYLLLCTLCLRSQCLNQNVPISLGRWGCSCMQSFRRSTASLTRCSFRPNSPLTFSSTSLVGGSITSSDILCLEEQNCVRCSKIVNFFYSKTRLNRVFQEECARLREDVPYVKLYQYNTIHPCPKLNV